MPPRVTVVHVRGTCGSGKSTLVAAILADARGAWVDGAARRQRYASAWNLEVITHDGVPTRDTEAAIWRAVLRDGRNVLFEGIYHSNLKQRWIDLALALNARGACWCDRYLATTLEECQRRVLERRARAENTRPYDPRHMALIYRNVLRRYAEMRAAGIDAAYLSATDPEGDVRALLDLPPKEPR